MKQSRSNKKLPIEFYLRDDVVQISKELLGKKLCSYIDGKYTSGLIVETEAYRAPEDLASHAVNNRRTARTESFYHDGGIAYVYLIYGIYKLFNIITNFQDIPHAVLIRAIEPLDGIDAMLERRGHTKVKRNLTGGPGLVSMAMGIEMEHNGLPMNGDTLWIEDAEPIKSKNIVASPRVGLGKNVLEPYFSIPWRFRVKDNPFTSPAK